MVIVVGMRVLMQAKASKISPPNIHPLTGMSLHAAGVSSYRLRRRPLLRSCWIYLQCPIWAQNVMDYILLASRATDHHLHYTITTS